MKGIRFLAIYYAIVFLRKIGLKLLRKLSVPQTHFFVIEMFYLLKRVREIKKLTGAKVADGGKVGNVNGLYGV